ncbi:uncharacterized protein LOC132262539 [Phlebotomus argentipes]|uniref:uncharacterized protein LOC132262539 n=1 Tax=Phlebotomus argentipes TaxID=94469 RepID=UPI00289347D9|nr:uncharacterized protein LOC132262539 [Phlebotomus argentipes]
MITFEELQKQQKPKVNAITQNAFPHKFTVYTLTIFICISITCAQIPHPAVLNIEQEENLLPDHLRNHFLRTPRVAAALAVSSWLEHGEEPVYEREADKIPRHEIYNVLTHAGFIPRRFYK